MTTKTKSKKPARKPAKGRKARNAKPAAQGRPDSKEAKLVAMLRSPRGATVTQLMTASNWQRHSIRGWMSARVRKALGLDLVSVGPKGEERVYRIA